MRSLLEKLPSTEIDTLVDTVCDLCLKHEKLAFIAGIKVGFELIREIET